MIESHDIKVSFIMDTSNNRCIDSGAERIDTMFMDHNTALSLWTALCKMCAHDHSDSCIFKLYQDIFYASQAALGLSIFDYFGYLQTRWEEVAQYEPITDFLNSRLYVYRF